MRILITTNGSSTPEKILRFCEPFVKCASDPPTILAVLNPAMDRTPSQTNTLLDEARLVLGVQNIQTKTRVGQPVEEIIHETQEGNYDLVVISNRQVRRLVGLFKKSSVNRIVAHANCSVLVVQGRMRPIHRILLCDSGAQEAQLLIKFRTQVVDLLGIDEEITILHVMSQISAGPGVRGQQLRAGADELIEIHTPEGDLLERDVDSLEESGLHPVPKIRHGLVVEEIMAETRSGDYDLIVIGIQRQKWQHFLLDDLTHQIIEQVDRPVLILK
jgi:nucleotide-binding universal stress UspA family protein